MSVELTACSRVSWVATTRIPTRHADFVAHAYHDEYTGEDHVVLVLGDLADGATPPLVRLHSECLTGEALGSRRCDCREQLDSAQAAIAAEGRGAVVYLRGHEGRGIGLAAKVRAYALQDDGLDTYDANLALGHDPDERDYTVAAQMLHALGVTSIALLSNNPDKRKQLRDNGIHITDQIPTGVHVSDSNARYLATKADRGGHLLRDIVGWRP